MKTTHIHHCNSTSRQEATKPQNPQKTADTSTCQWFKQSQSPTTYERPAPSQQHTSLSDRPKNPIQSCITPPRNQPQILANNAVHDTDKVQSTPHPRPSSPRHWALTPATPKNQMQRPKGKTTLGSLPLQAAPTALLAGNTHVTMKKKNHNM